MKLSTILISVFMISMFVTGYIGLYEALLNSQNYTIPERGSFNRSNSSSSTLNTIARMYNISEMSQNTTRETGGVESDLLTNLFSGAWEAVWQIFTIPAFFGGLITDLTGVAGIPEWVSVSLFAIISIIVIFGMYYFITGRDS